LVLEGRLQNSRKKTQKETGKNFPVTERGKGGIEEKEEGEEERGGGGLSYGGTGKKT